MNVTNAQAALAAAAQHRYATGEDLDKTLARAEAYKRWLDEQDRQDFAELRGDA